MAAFDRICARAAGEQFVRSRDIQLCPPTADESPPEDVPDETEVREQIAVMVESGALDEESARGFEELAHDPLTRRAFARRHMSKEAAAGVT